MGIRLWLIILAGGFITYLIRLSFILAQERLRVPEWFSRGLKYVPAAVLSAIIVPELANWNGKIVNITWTNPQIWAGILAVVVAWKTRNLFLTLAAGLVCFLVLHVWM